MAKGSDDEAIKAYREALYLKGDDGLIHYNLGLIYDRKGLLDEAVVEYRQSLKLLPDNYRCAPSSRRNIYHAGQFSSGCRAILGTCEDKEKRR